MIHIKIVTPNGMYLEDDIKEFHLTTVEGQRTILSNHAPLFAALVPCPLILRKEGEEKEYALAGGFLTFGNNEAQIMTDAIEGYDEIDIERARESYERAVRRMQKKDTNTNMRRSELSLARAINRISVYERH